MPVIEPRRLADQVSRLIRTDIEAGRLKDREALKPERELAREYGVSAKTIGNALRPLIAEGLIITKERSRRYVNNPGPVLPVCSTDRGTLVIVIGGFAGSGKTELGRILSRMTSWPLLDKDSVTRPVTEAALELAGLPVTDRESEVYLTRVRPAEYETLTLVMTENIECGNNVIISAPFIREFTNPGWFQRLETACSGAQARCVFVWVDTNADSMLQYLRHRAAGRDTWKLTHWQQYISQIDLAMRPVAEHVVIDNSMGAPPLRDQAAALLRSLGVEPRC